MTAVASSSRLPVSDCFLSTSGLFCPDTTEYSETGSQNGAKPPLPFVDWGRCDTVRNQSAYRRFRSRSQPPASLFESRFRDKWNPAARRANYCSLCEELTSTVRDRAGATSPVRFCATPPLPVPRLRTPRIVRIATPADTTESCRLYPANRLELPSEGPSDDATPARAKGRVDGPERRASVYTVSGAHVRQDSEDGPNWPVSSRQRSFLEPPLFLRMVQDKLYIDIPILRISVSYLTATNHPVRDSQLVEYSG